MTTTSFSRAMVGSIRGHCTNFAVWVRGSAFGVRGSVVLVQRIWFFGSEVLVLRFAVPALLIQRERERRTEDENPERRTRADERGVEGQGQQILELMPPLELREVRELDLEVAAELPQDLAARTAGRRRRLGVGDNRDPGEDAMAFRERLEHGDALGAN